MASLPDWLSKSKKVAIDAPVLALIALKPSVPDELGAHLAQSGLWWMVPFGESGVNSVIGVRAMPGVPLRESPVINWMQGTIGTVATRPGVLVPMLVIEQIRGPDDYWNQVAEWPASHWEQLGRLHTALGGAGELEALRKLVLDDGVRKRCLDGSKGVWSRFKEIARLMTAVDKSPELKTCLDYVIVAATREDAPVPPPDAGCYGPALAMASFVVNLEQDNEDETFAAAWDVLQQSPDLDPLGPGDSPSLYPSWGADGGKTQIEAAKTLIRRAKEARKEWLGDPLWAAVEALAAKGEKYDGAAHVAAAAKMEPQRAFATLTAAAHFRKRSGAKGANKPLEAARALCAKQKWSELSGALGK